MPDCCEGWPEEMIGLSCWPCPCSFRRHMAPYGQELVKPDAFDAHLPTDVPVNSTSGHRIGTAHVTRDGDRLAVSMTLDEGG